MSFFYKSTNSKDTGKSFRDPSLSGRTFREVKTKIMTLGKKLGARIVKAIRNKYGKQEKFIDERSAVTLRVIDPRPRTLMDTYYKLRVQYKMLNNKHGQLDKNYVYLTKQNKKLQKRLKNRTKRITSLKRKMEDFQENEIFLDSGHIQFSTDILNENNVMRKDGNHIILLPKIADKNGVMITPYTKLYDIKLLYKCLVLNYVSKVLRFSGIPANYFSEVPSLDVIYNYFLIIKYKSIRDCQALRVRIRIDIEIYTKAAVIVIFKITWWTFIIIDIILVVSAVVYIYRMYWLTFKCDLFTLVVRYKRILAKTKFGSNIFVIKEFLFIYLPKKVDKIARPLFRKFLLS